MTPRICYCCGNPTESALTVKNPIANNEAKRATTRSRKQTKDKPKKGGIYAALRRSPLIGANLNLTRPFNPGRKIDL